MKVKRLFIIIFVSFAFSVCVAAQDSPKSYYVRSSGNDGNNGRSEESAFKTLSRAIDVAMMGVIKKITIIGTLDYKTEGSASTDAVFVISYSGTEELVITGKSVASVQDKAVLSALGTKLRVVAITNSGKGGVRFENIEISGANIINDGAGIKGPFNGNWTIGEKVTVKNNKTTGKGGGILASGTLTISKGAVISNNSASYGGGIYIPYSWNSVVIDGGSIINNIATNNGGGIFLESGSNSLNLKDGSVMGNKATLGGGMYLDDPTIMGTVVISDNIATKNGGGIYIALDEKDPITIDMSTITGNKAEFGAGIYLAPGSNEYAWRFSSLIIKAGKIAQNAATFVGGGVYVGKNSKLDKGACVFEGNSAGDGAGEDTFIQE